MTDTAFTRALCTASLLLAFAARAAADEKAGPKAPPDEKAAMEAMTRAATPGEAHKRLDPLVGTFDASAKMWPAPGKPPEESKGTSENKWVLGNRYVEQRYQGTFMGQPFNGIGYTGYDNVWKRYVSVWMDDAGTGMMVSSGKASGAHAVDTHGTVYSPVTGKPERVTEKLTVADADHHTLEMWAPAPDGKPFKVMEIAYTRRK